MIKPNRKKRHSIGYYIGLCIMLAGAVIMILPLYWMIMSAFKGQTELFADAADNVSA